MSAHPPIHLDQTTMSLPSPTTAGCQVPWERLAADAKLAIASALDLHFGSPAPQLSHPSGPAASGMQVTENVRQFLSETHNTPPPHASNDTTTSRRRKSTTDAADTVSYTPATHRISKAKKGKRVHACQFPGCSKVFTRAEHRRRHELNHNPQASFVCKIKGCRKGFHRSDLLTRHLEKHDSDARTPPKSPQTGSQRRDSQATTLSDSAAITSPQPLPSPVCTLPSQPLTSQTAAVSTTSATMPVATHGKADQDLPIHFWGSSGAPYDQFSGSLEGVYPYSEDIPPYLSPDRSESPSSDGNPCQRPVQQAVQHSPAPSISGSSFLDSPPPVNVTFPDWNALEATIQATEPFPVKLEQGNLQTSYNGQYPSYANWADINHITYDGNVPLAPETFPVMNEWR